MKKTIRPNARKFKKLTVSTGIRLEIPTKKKIIKKYKTVQKWIDLKVGDEFSRT